MAHIPIGMANVLPEKPGAWHAVADQIDCIQMLLQPGLPPDGIQQPGHLAGGSAEQNLSAVFQIGGNPGDAVSHVALDILAALQLVQFLRSFDADMPDDHIIAHGRSNDHAAAFQEGFCHGGKNPAGGAFFI